MRQLRLADVYISRSHNPFFNLAFEDWIFSSKPRETCLFLYTNNPCVVIGSNQNPWTEVNLPVLAERGGYFVRRRSGGGTVYHDLGNLNFSISMMRDSFNRARHSQMVVDALASIHVDAHLNERFDVCIRNQKISGSAFKISKDRAYHHGTLLVQSNLAQLRGVLQSAVVGIDSKGVSSVKSPVANICDTHSVSISSVSDALIREFSNLYNIEPVVETVEETSEGPHATHTAKLKKTLQDAQNLWRHTPPFVHNVECDDLVSLSVHRGIVNKASHDSFVDHPYGEEFTGPYAECINKATCVDAVKKLTLRAGT